VKLVHALRLHPREVVALVGGGGKTTLMFRLADELVEAGRRVVTTMTTRIFVGQMARAPVALTLDDLGDLPAQAAGLLRLLPGALAAHGHVLIAGGRAEEPDKAQGIPPALADLLAAQPDVDCVIVEADGSRRLSFKAPAEHEPVMPSTATIVMPVAGMDVVGRPLDAAHVHRPLRVAELTAARLGDPVTAEMIAITLAHPQGGSRGAPPAARLMPFLNKVEDEMRLDSARQVARLLLRQPRVDSVLIGAAEAADPVAELWSRVAAVVLAAGESRRFGALKQVMPWRGATLVAHVAAQALACPDVDRVAVTVGAEAERVIVALEPDGLHKAFGADRLLVVAAPDWAGGQSHSVLAGLTAVGGLPGLSPQASPSGDSAPDAKTEPAAVIFLLADQPGVSPTLLSALVQRHRETLAPVVAPRFEGRRGNPVLFDRATFREFAGLHGDIGGRPIIQAHGDAIAWVDWPTPEILQDLDRAEDYLYAASGTQAGCSCSGLLLGI